MRASFVKAIRKASGVTAIEYALIGGLISIGIVVGATQVGVKLSGFFTAIATAFP